MDGPEHTSDAVERLTAWIRDYGHEKQPQFIADLRSVLKAVPRTAVRRIDQHGFMECRVCAAKAGTPALCESCLRNRERIWHLSEQLQQLKERPAKSQRFYTASQIFRRFIPGYGKSDDGE